MSELILAENDYLAWVAVHGASEQTGLDLRFFHTISPIYKWDVEIANEEAVALGVRSVKHNLATVVGIADENSPDYELRRPVEMKRRSRNRREVWDVHDRPYDGGDFVTIGDNADVSLLGAATLMSINRVIVYRHRLALPGNIEQAMGIELGRGKQNQLILPNVRRLRECMQSLANDEKPVPNPAEFVFYERVAEISTEQADRLKLREAGYLETFQEIPQGIVERLAEDFQEEVQLDLSETYVNMYWNRESSSPDWFGDILKVINPPF